MAATKSAKNPTSGNDTPNTPGVKESAIAAMKVGELRRELQNRGVSAIGGTITIGSGEDDDTKRIAVALPGLPA